MNVVTYVVGFVLVTFCSLLCYRLMGFLLNVLLNSFVREMMNKTLVRVSDYTWLTTMFFQTDPIKPIADFCGTLEQLIRMNHIILCCCSLLVCLGIALIYKPHFMYFFFYVHPLILFTNYWMKAMMNHENYIRMSDFRDALALMRRCFMFWAVSISLLSSVFDGSLVSYSTQIFLLTSFVWVLWPIFYQLALGCYLYHCWSLHYI